MSSMHPARWKILRIAFTPLRRSGISLALSREKLEPTSEFVASPPVIRAACRRFLERVGVNGREVAHYMHTIAAIGQAGRSICAERDTSCGVQLARIATQFKLDIHLA